MQTSLRLTGIALAILLSACGSGNSVDTSSNSKAASTLPASTLPVTSVPAPVYTGGPTAPQVAIFSGINILRSAMTTQTGVGVGLLAQDPDLDVAAQAHAQYLLDNNVEVHDEVPGTTGFDAISPLGRAQNAGVPGNAWVGESIGNASNCVQQLLGTVYHLQVLTGSAEHIGIGYNSLVCVIEEATLTGVTNANAPQISQANETNAIPTWGGQQLPPSSVAYSPAAGSTVPTTMSAGEIPRAASDISNPGYPIMVRVRADNNDSLTVTSFTLSNASGPLPGELLIAGNAQTGSIANSVSQEVTADPLIEDGVVFFIPDSPLASGTTYTASFTGGRDGVSVGPVSWTFLAQ